MKRYKGTHLRTSEPIFGSPLENFFGNPVIILFPDESSGTRHGLAVKESSHWISQETHTIISFEYISDGDPKNKLLASLGKQVHTLELLEYGLFNDLSISLIAALHLLGPPYLEYPYALSKKIFSKAATKYRTGKSLEFCEKLGIPNAKKVTQVAFKTIEETYRNHLKEKNFRRWLKDDGTYTELREDLDRHEATLIRIQKLTEKTRDEVKKREEAVIQKRIGQILNPILCKLKT